MEMARESVTDPIDQTLVATPVAAVGCFRLSTSHPAFKTFGAISRHWVAFPRRAVWIGRPDHQPFVADATRATLYNPGDEYWRAPIDRAGDHADLFAVAPSVLRDALQNVDPAAADRENDLFTRPFAPIRSDIYLRQRVLFEYVQSTPDPDLLYVEEAVVNLVADAATADADEAGAAHAPVRQARQFDMAEATCALLNRHYRTSLALSDIASALGVSVFHLCRLFRRFTGSTIHQHREHLRLRASLAAILETDADLLSIGMSLGYSSHSHFTRAFRRRFQMTPSELRQTKKAGRVDAERQPIRAS